MARGFLTKLPLDWPKATLKTTLLAFLVEDIARESPIFFFFFFFFFGLLRAAPAAYGSSQAKGHIRAEAAGLHHSHSNEGSKPHLPPTPQATATLDP